MTLPKSDTSVGFEIDGVVIKQIQQIPGFKPQHDIIYLEDKISENKCVIKMLPKRPQAHEAMVTTESSGEGRGKNLLSGVADQADSGAILLERGTINVVVAHRNLLFRQGIIELLNKECDFNVLGQVRGSEDLVKVVYQTQPDVVLVDCELPGLHIEPLVKKISFVAPYTRIVLLTQLLDPYLLRKLVTLGVRACVTPDGSEAELRSAIRAVVDDADRVVFSVTQEAVDKLGNSDRLLSKREVEVLELAAKGLTSTEIGASLFIAEGTVKRHLTNIYSKLDVKTRIRAISKAITLGLIKNEAGK